MYQNRLLGEYNYDAFGSSIINYLFADNVEERQVLRDNPFRWKGYYYDKETNLFLITSRYYSPELGRFIQRSDVSSLNLSSINGLNLYSYANNNLVGIAYSSSSYGGNFYNNTPYSNSSNILGALGAMSSAFGFFDQWSGFISGGVDAGLSYWGPDGFGFRFLETYSSGLSKFGKAMVIAGSVLSWASSVYNNFTNPNYSVGEAFGASAMDAVYYAGKGLGTYHAGLGIGKLAVGAGIAGAVGIYYLGEFLDDGWDWLKEKIFE